LFRSYSAGRPRAGNACGDCNRHGSGVRSLL
jgi:hypothetical protein